MEVRDERSRSPAGRAAAGAPPSVGEGRAARARCRRAGNRHRPGARYPCTWPGLHRHRVGDPDDAAVESSIGSEHMFYHVRVGVEYREEPCRSALNRVKGMGFGWSLNPYMGCAHRCTFCYVRAFELRADRPSDDRYGTLDPREGERRRGAPHGAGTAVVAGRDGRDRRCHRPVPAGRGPLQADPRLPRGAPRRGQPVQPDHAQPDDRPRPRRPRRGREAGARSASSSRCRRSTRRSGGAPSPGHLPRAGASRRSGDSSTPA